MTARRGHAVVAAIALAIAALLAANASAGDATNERAGASDDGATPGARSEVWRMSGRLTSRDGHAFDYAATFFRFAPVRGPEMYPATVSIVDETSSRRFAERRTERGAFGLGGAAARTLDVHVGDWSLHESRGEGAAPAFDLAVHLAGVGLRLHGVAAKGAVALPIRGIAHRAYTSIDASASLDIGSEHAAVSGKSWLDHATGIAANPPAGLRLGSYHVALDDGREIDVETAADAASGTRDRTGYLVRRDGTLEILGDDRYAFANSGRSTWLSTHTRIRYPDIWGLTVFGETQNLLLQLVKIDQEATAGGEGASFYDGAVDVYDVTPGSQGRRLGSGSVLLVGFDREVTGR